MGTKSSKFKNIKIAPTNTSNNTSDNDKEDEISKPILTKQSNSISNLKISTSNNDPTVYIIVNTSIAKMSIGKIASQIAHGVFALHNFLLDHNIDHNRWLINGEKIVVLKSDFQSMNSLIDEYEIKILKSNCVNIFPIFDAGRTQIEPNSLTILISTPITDDKVPEIIKSMKLY